MGRGCGRDDDLEQWVGLQPLCGPELDGRNKAAVGWEHAAEKRFETEVRHEHEAFRNFTGYGIRLGYQQKVASAEINYLNCLFENCGTGVAFMAFNDYDNSFDGCEFRDCCLLYTSPSPRD